MRAVESVAGIRYGGLLHQGVARQKTVSVHPKPVFASAPKAPLNKPSAFSNLPFYMQPLVGLVVYCYTHPRSMLSVMDVIYPKAFRGAQKGALTDQYLPLFDPRTEVSFKSADGLKLKGHWLPAPKPAERTAILGHGYFAEWRSMLVTATELRKNGYNVFLFDFRAHGDSQGEKTTFGYNEGKDIAGAIRYVVENHPEQSKSLFYYGHSMGAAGMLMAQRSLQKHPADLALLNRHVKAIALDSPYSNFKEMVERFVNNIDSLDSEPGLMKTLGKIVGVPIKKFFGPLLEGIRTVGQEYTDIDVAFDEIRPAQLYADAKPPQKPILILHGTADSVVEARHGQITYDIVKAHNVDTRLALLPGVDHINKKWQPANDGKMFNSSYRSPEQVETVVKFFNAIKFGFSGSIKRLLSTKSG